MIDYRNEQGMRGDPNFAKEASDPRYRQKRIEGAYFADHPDVGRGWAARQEQADAEWQRSHAAGPATASSGPSALAGDAQRSFQNWQAMREHMERPIKMNLEAPQMPSQLVPRFRRANAREALSRETRDARWLSYSDIGAA